MMKSRSNASTLLNRPRHSRGLPAALLCIALLLLPAPNAAQVQEPLRTTPEHPFGAQPFGVPRPMPRRVRPKIVYSLDGERFDALARFEPQLTRLCRQGAFTQIMDGWLYARTPQRRYGVAFPNGANLYDPQQRRRPDLVYFFRDQDSSRCRVYVARQGLMAPYWTTRR